MFRITPDPTEPGRWNMMNTYMGFSHRSYGTLEQVTASAQRQSEAWEKRRNSRDAPKPYTNLEG